MKKLKKGLAVVLSAAMLAGLTPGVGSMKVSAVENGSGTDSISGGKLSAISGTKGASDDEDYGMLIDGKYSSTNAEDYSKWCVKDFSGAYIIFRASEAGYVTGYSITTGNDNADEHGRNPKDWKLYGCNDSSADRDSTSWVEIHSVKNDKVLQDQNYKTYDYELDSLMAEKYQYFKLEITANQGASVMQMSEFTLKYSSCDHQWSDTGEGVEATCTEKAYKVQQCSKCNETVKLYTGDALGRDIVEGYCSRCDAIIYQKVNYLDESGESKAATCYIISEITDSLTDTEEQPGWYVVKDDVTIDKRITIDGNVHLVLADNSSLTVNGGIEVSDGNSLSIYAQSKGTGMGSLIVQNVVENYAGIGSGKNDTGGNITIAGGKVTSTGGEEGAGIGGGFQAEGGNICITGGIVTANGGMNGAGIGVGAIAMGAKVIISGGIVRATGNNGIGFGNNSPEDRYSVTFATQGETDSSSGNAVIFAKSSGYAANISDTSGKDTSWSGVIFEENSGKVYGSSVTPTQSFTIDSGKTLTIDSEKTLTIPSGVTLDNQGSFIVKGRVINYSDTDVKGTREENGEIHQDLNHDGVCDNCASEGSCSYFDNVTVREYSNTATGKSGEDITLSASVTPKTAEQTVTFQWYEKSADNTYTAVNEAVGNSYVVKKVTKGIYEYRLAAECDGVVRWIPFTVEVTCDCLAYENGFCTICGGYEPAKETTDQYDIDGDSMKDTVYEISNAGQLYWFAGLVNGDSRICDYDAESNPKGTQQNTAACAVLTADITVNKDLLKNLNDDGTAKNGYTVQSWTPIGSTCKYTGTFDGQKHTISGLYFCDSETTLEVGLVGCAWENSSILNVGVVDSYFKGKNHVGGICGMSYNCTIKNCYNTGKVEGNIIVGGVCGQNMGYIVSCYNEGSVSGTGDVGGVFGYSEVGISNCCYNTGLVSGTRDVGGICGRNYGLVDNCYYLSGTSTSGMSEGSTGGHAEEKTTDEFASGEVAYLLQDAQTADVSGTVPQVWGQKLSDTGRQNYPVLGGAKIYKTIGCTVGYSNEENDRKNHDFGQDNVCKDCGWDKGIIENKSGEEGYPAEFMYNGTAITAPEADNFTVNSGAAAAFTWYKGDVTAAEDLSAAAQDKMNALPVHAGTYTLVVTADAVAGETDTEKDYSAAELRVKVVVKKADSKVVTPPTGVSGLVYDSGKKLTLIHDTEVSVTGGEVQYALGTADGTYSTSLPTVKDAGTYDVYYKVVGDDNHNDTKPLKITVTVDKATPTYTVPANLTANCGDKLSTVSLIGTGFVWMDDTDAVLEAGSAESGQTVTKTAKYVPTDKDNYKEVTGIELSITVTHKLSTQQLVGKEGAEKHASHCSACNNDFHEAACSGGTATCSEKAVCSVCKGHYGGINPENHTGETETVNAKDATCKETGYTGDTKCQGCGKIIETGSEIPKLNTHTYVNGVCSVCDKIWEDTINGITYQAITTLDENGKLVGQTVTVSNDVPQVAVAVVKADVTDTNKVTIPGDITGSGSAQNFVVTKVEANAFAGTTAAEVVVPGTVTEVGAGAFGDVKVVTFNSETAPSGVEKAVSKDTTVNVPEGAADSYREALGESVNIVEAHTHTYADTWTYDDTHHWHADTCGHEEEVADKAEHTFGEWTVTKEATEDAKGLKERSCACGYKETEEIAQLPHTTHIKDKGTRVEPTCEKKGSITYKCTKCGQVMEVVELAATGHTEVVDAAVKPTCEKAGKTEGKHCKVCNKVLKAQQEVKATGHKWDAGKVTKKATETVKGVKTYTCTVCKKTKTESIPKKQAATPKPLKKGDVIKDDKGTAKYEILDTAKKVAAYKEPVNKKAKTVIIPTTVKMNGVTYKVTKIADNAFKGNKTVIKVTVGSSIKSIGKNAFSEATKLKKVSIGKNVIEIGANAFKGCTSLTSVILPSKTTKIGANAFNGCKKLKTIKITSTKLTSKTVAKNAFKGLTKATTIKVPKKKLNAYKKLFKQKGLSSKVKVKGY